MINLLLFHAINALLAVFQANKQIRGLHAVFYVDKQYFNMVILFLRLRVRRELIIRRDGRAVEGTGLENRRPERVPEFESLRFRQIR